jgi:hypothetical protein
MTYSKDSIMRKMALVTAAAGLALGGCAGQKTPLEADYGQSVKQMITHQVYDRRTLYKPNAAPVEGADPDMINLAVQSLRTEKVDRTQVNQPLTINIGAQGQ